MDFIRLAITCDPGWSEILIAEFGEIGYDTFLETNNGFEAYIEEDRYDYSSVFEIVNKYRESCEILFSVDRIEKKNWNEEWEKNYEPIVVENKCLIRAHFHKPDQQYPYEIIITPKMSFGTGHHQTTYLMIQNQMNIDHRYKYVMDAGCGTAILSIMASKLGAKEVEAFDIDEWSVNNGKENIEVNECTNIHIQQGKIDELDFQRKFDIIIANINKIVLMEEMRLYVQHLNVKGQLLISGFYEHDIDDLVKKASSFGLKKTASSVLESWACLVLG